MSMAARKKRRKMLDMGLARSPMGMGDQVSTETKRRLPKREGCGSPSWALQAPRLWELVLDCRYGLIDEGWFEFGLAVWSEWRFPHETKTIPMDQLFGASFDIWTHPGQVQEKYRRTTGPNREWNANAEWGK